MEIRPSSFILRKPFLSIAFNKKLNSTERGALFRHFGVSKVIATAHAQKVVSFFIFFQELSTRGFCRGASLGFRQNGLTGLSWNRRIDQHDQESKQAM